MTTTEKLNRATQQLNHLEQKDLKMFVKLCYLIEHIYSTTAKENKQ